ncbi:MAG: TetR/AcrR family transcriptional regulator [Marmoricola sp.]
MSEVTAGASGVRAPRVRMQPDERREQLIDIGVRMLATRALEDLSIDALSDEAGISRGLLYHYFANKTEFHVAVVKKLAGDLYQITAPTSDDDPIVQLRLSLDAYVSYVVANHGSYLALVRAVSSGNAEMIQIYRDARAALIERLFERAPALDLEGIVDTPAAARLVAHSWAVFVEDLVLAWIADDSGLSRDALLDKLTGVLVFLLAG